MSIMIVNFKSLGSKKCKHCIGLKKSLAPECIRSEYEELLKAKIQEMKENEETKRCKNCSITLEEKEIICEKCYCYYCGKNLDQDSACKDCCVEKEEEEKCERKDCLYCVFKK